MTEKEFQEWVDIDQNIPIIAPLTDDDIIKSFDTNDKEKGDDEEEDGSDDDEHQERIPVSRQETIAALNTIRRAMEENGNTDYLPLYQIETSLSKFLNPPKKQTKILDFFNQH